MNLKLHARKFSHWRTNIQKTVQLHLVEFKEGFWLNHAMKTATSFCSLKSNILHLPVGLKTISYP